MNIFFKHCFDTIDKLRNEITNEGFDLQYYDSGVLILIDSKRNCIELKCDSIQELISQMILVLRSKNSIDNIVSDNENYNLKVVLDKDGNIILNEEWSDKNANIKLIFEKTSFLQENLLLFEETCDELKFYIPELGMTSQFKRLREFTIKPVNQWDAKQNLPTTYDFYTDFIYLSGDIYDLYEFLKSDKTNFQIEWYLIDKYYKFSKELQKTILIQSFSSSSSELCSTFEIDGIELELRTSLFISDMNILIRSLFPIGYSRMNKLGLAIYT